MSHKLKAETSEQPDATAPSLDAPAHDTNTTHVTLNAEYVT